MKKLLKIPRRAVLYTKDVSLITGKGRTAARDLYNNVLRTFNKQPGQFLTLKEFSLYSGIELETLLEYVNS